MKHVHRCLFVFVVLLAVSASGQLAAQDLPVPATRSAKKALALSLLLPGLGHQYAHHGSWRGSATLYALADAAFWASLVDAEIRQRNLEDDFRTLAAARADAVVDGKGREFFLNLATYRSSDAYLDTMLRNRAWNRIDYVSTRAYQWQWQTEADFVRFRDLRDEAESKRRRRTVLIGVLITNRIIAGITAARAARRANAAAAPVSLSLSAPPPGSVNPAVNVRVRF